MSRRCLEIFGIFIANITYSIWFAVIGHVYSMWKLIFKASFFYVLLLPIYLCYHIYYYFKNNHIITILKTMQRRKIAPDSFVQFLLSCIFWCASMWMTMYEFSLSDWTLRNTLFVYRWSTCSQIRQAPWLKMTCSSASVPSKLPSTRKWGATYTQCLPREARAFQSFTFL